MYLLAEREDLKWAAFEAAVEVGRQNGKGGIYEIRELAGLFLLGERLLIHSAHEYKTAEQALDRMDALLEGAPHLSRQVRTIKRSHGQEGVYLKSGQSLRYFTRTASGGRGFSCDFLGMDEAFKIKASMHAAMFPTMAARENPQILYAGSAVDQETMDDGIVFARLRERAKRGGDPRLAYFGWSAPFDHPDQVTPEAARDPENWARANPAFGIRITADYIEMEQRALSARGFAVERLGVGDWPATDEDADRKITKAAWKALTDRSSAMVNPVCFAYDVSPDRSTASISAAGPRRDGKWLVELVDKRPGTGWLADRLFELSGAHRPAAIVGDKIGPAGSLLEELTRRKLRKLKPIGTSELVQACGVFYDAVNDDTLRHGGQPELDAAIDGADTRPLGDAWAWARKTSDADITPLVSGTLALWAASARKGKRSGVVDLHEALERAERAEREARQ